MGIRISCMIKYLWRCVTRARSVYSNILSLTNRETGASPVGSTRQKQKGLRKGGLFADKQSISVVYGSRLKKIYHTGCFLSILEHHVLFGAGVAMDFFWLEPESNFVGSFFQIARGMNNVPDRALFHVGECWRVSGEVAADRTHVGS